MTQKWLGVSEAWARENWKHKPSVHNESVKEFVKQTKKEPPHALSNIDLQDFASCLLSWNM